MVTESGNGRTGCQNMGGDRGRRFPREEEEEEVFPSLQLPFALRFPLLLFLLPQPPTPMRGATAAAASALASATAALKKKEKGGKGGRSKEKGREQRASQRFTYYLHASSFHLCQKPFAAATEKEGRAVEGGCRLLTLGPSSSSPSSSPSSSDRGGCSYLHCGRRRGKKDKKEELKKKTKQVLVAHHGLSRKHLLRKC